jgi:hypothetical protein
VAALNPTFGRTGESDHAANVRALQPGESVEWIIATVRPLLVIASGGPVRKAVSTSRWKPEFGVLRFADHPSAWEGFGTGRRHRADLVIPMLHAWARTGTVPSA